MLVCCTVVVLLTLYSFAHRRSFAALALQLRTVWSAIRWRELSDMRAAFEEHRRSHQVALRALDRGSPHLAHMARTFFELRDTELIARTIIERRPLDGRVELQFEYLVESVHVPYECATGSLDLLNAAGKARAYDDYVTFYDSDEESVDDLLAPVGSARGASGTRRSLRNAQEAESQVVPTRERVWLPEGELEAWQIKSFLEQQQPLATPTGSGVLKSDTSEATAGPTAGRPPPKAATTNSTLAVTLKLLNNPKLRGLCLEPERAKQLQPQLPGELQFLGDDLNSTLERLKPLIALPATSESALNGGAAARFQSPQMPMRLPMGASPSRAPFPPLHPSFMPRAAFGLMAPTSSCIEVFRPGAQRPPAPTGSGVSAASSTIAASRFIAPPVSRSSTLSRPLPAIAAAMQQKAAEGRQKATPNANANAGGEQKKPLTEADRPQKMPIDDALLVSLLRVAVAFGEGTDQHTDLLRLRRHFENEQREKLEQSARADRAAKQQSTQKLKAEAGKQAEQRPAPLVAASNSALSSSRNPAANQQQQPKQTEVAAGRRPIARRVLKSGTRLARLLETRVVDLHASLERRRLLLESLLRHEVTDELIRAYAFQCQQQLALNPPEPVPELPAPEAIAIAPLPDLKPATGELKETLSASGERLQARASDPVDTAAAPGAASKTEVKLESVDHHCPLPQPPPQTPTKAHRKRDSRRPHHRSKRVRNESCSSCSSSASSVSSSNLGADASRRTVGRKSHSKKKRHRREGEDEPRREESGDEVPLKHLQKRTSHSRSSQSTCSSISSCSSSSAESSPAKPSTPSHSTARKRGRKQTTPSVSMELDTSRLVFTTSASCGRGGGRGGGRGSGRGSSRGRPPRGAAGSSRADGLTCSSCGGARSDLSCDLCSRWFHAQCIGRSHEELDSLEQFTCPECDKSRSAVGAVLYCICRQPYDEKKYAPLLM